MRYLILFTLLLAACTPAANPATPAVIVVTATPPGSPAAPGTVVTFFTPTPPIITTPTATPAPDESGLVPTSVEYVLAKQDINIRSGPGTTFEIVGGVYAGQTAEVTSYQSADSKWWRVVCPTDAATECWVSADPELTEPTTVPGGAATATPLAQADTEQFVRQLNLALQNKDYAALETMMGDPFTIGYWRSEGTEPTRAEALTLLKNWLDPADDVVVDLADKTDQTKLLDGTNPLTMWNPAVNVVKSVYVTGLDTDGKSEALFIIARRADSTLYLYGMLFAGTGGFEALNG